MSELRYTCSYQELYKSVLECALYAYYNFDCTDYNDPRIQFRKNLNFCIYSEPGRGKSAYIKHHCHNLGIECESIIISQISAADATGIEIPKNQLNSNKIEIPLNKLTGENKTKILSKLQSGILQLDETILSKDGKIILDLSNDEEPELVFCPPAWMKEVHEKASIELTKGKPFILHLDEINTADRFLMKIYLGIILDHKLRTYTWPDNIIIIASGNYDFDTNDPAFMTRFINCASDKTEYAELPICSMQQYEMDRLVNNAMKLQFNIGNEEPRAPLNDNFTGITVPANQLNKLQKVLLEVFDQARIDANTSNSHDLICNYHEGITGLKLNFRTAELLLSAFVAAIKTNNWNPVLIRCLCDNLGTGSDKTLYYSKLAEIKTIEVIDGDIKCIDYAGFETLYRDQITESFENGDGYTPELLQSMLTDFHRMLNYYSSLNDSEVTAKIKGQLLIEFKTSIGIVYYSKKVQDKFNLIKLYTDEVDNKFKQIIPLLLKITGLNSESLLV